MIKPGSVPQPATTHLQYPHHQSHQLPVVLSHEQASQRLTALMGEFSGNDAIAVNFAEIARSKSEAASLREALERLGEVTTPIRRAYLKHQLAVLEGDTDAAGSAATEWFELERDNPMAATAAVIAVGIGQGRWNEAVAVADYALSKFPHDRVLVNNYAYVLAMNGRAEEVISLLEPIAGDDFVLNLDLSCVQQNRRLPDVGGCCS